MKLKLNSCAYLARFSFHFSTPQTRPTKRENQNWNSNFRTPVFWLLLLFLFSLHFFVFVSFAFVSASQPLPPKTFSFCSPLIFFSISLHQGIVFGQWEYLYVSARLAPSVRSPSLLLKYCLRLLSFFNLERNVKKLQKIK